MHLLSHLSEEYKAGYNRVCYGRIEHREFNPHIGDDSVTGLRKLYAWYDGFDAGLESYREEMGIKLSNWRR